jgi:hypothetical protein
MRIACRCRDADGVPPMKGTRGTIEGMVASFLIAFPALFSIVNLPGGP